MGLVKQEEPFKNLLTQGMVNKDGKKMSKSLGNVVSPEEIIKKFHFILKDGTLTDSEKEWFNVGEYKKRKNFVGNIVTSLPNDVERDMKDLLKWYDRISTKNIEDIVEFHVRFEKIHPFQDENDTLVKNATYPQNAYKLRFSN